MGALSVKRCWLLFSFTRRENGTYGTRNGGFSIGILETKEKVRANRKLTGRAKGKQFENGGA